MAKRKKKKNNTTNVIYILLVTIVILVLVVIAVFAKGCGKKDVSVIGENDTNEAVEELTPEQIVDETAAFEEGLNPDGTPLEEVTEEEETAAGTMTEGATSEEGVAEEGVAEVKEEITEEKTDEQIVDETALAEEEEMPAQTFGAWDLSTLSGDSVPYGFDRDKKDAKGAPEGIAFYQSKWGEYNVDFISDRTDENVIYLTMDEGFANEQTAQVLDILRDKNVKVTFFCTSDFVNNCPQFIERMINEGHRIGCHSITHRKMPSLDLATQKEEIMDVVNIMKDKYNYDVRLFRFPEGEFSDQSLALVENCGLKSVFWSFAYRDFAAEQPDVQESLQLTLNSVHPGAIYLLHANSSTNLALLPDFIDGVRAKGYEFAGVYPVD